MMGGTPVSVGPLACRRAVAETLEPEVNVLVLPLAGKPTELTKDSYRTCPLGYIGWTQCWYVYSLSRV